MEIKENLRGKRIAVGLSGGVDSSVAALLLRQAGYDVFALFMQNWHDITGTLHGECEWEEDRKVAEMVARKIGIPFEFIDLSDTYRHQVVDYMFSEYAKGRTPNPDVMCNSRIKFDAFLKAARDLGADYVATGHYCRKDVTDGPDGRPVYRILAGADGNKDQSYFLCQLTQEQLAPALFPIGDIVKPEVRRLAREAGRRTRRASALWARWTCRCSSSRNWLRGRAMWWRFSRISTVVSWRNIRAMRSLPMIRKWVRQCRKHAEDSVSCSRRK